MKYLSHTNISSRRAFSLAAILLLTVFSCHRQEPEATPSELTVAEARTWFERTYGTSPSGRRLSEHKDIEQKPRWDKAATAPNEVRVPVETWFAKKTLLNRTNGTRLVVRRTGGRWEARYIETVADAAYAKRKKGLVQREDFTGMVSELDGEGRFVSGQLWRDGKTVAELQPAQEANPSGRTTGCGTFTTVTIAYGGFDYEGRSFTFEIGRYYRNYTICSHQPKIANGGGEYYEPTGYGSGSGGNDNGGLVVSEFTMPNAAAAGIAAGPKPAATYTNKCTGIQTMWNNSVANKRERIGFVTQNGGLLETSNGGYDNVNVSGLYESNGVTYEQSANAKMPTWPGTLSNPAGANAGNIRVYVPVVATVHTHVPCVDDGTNGVSHPVGTDDHTMAARFPTIRHYVVGCNGTVAEFSASSDIFFNVVSNKPLSESCESVK